MARRAKKLRDTPAFRVAGVIAVVWVLQVVVLVWLLDRAGWDDYWALRRIYRPGLRVFSGLFDAVLRPEFFSPLNRRGIVVGFSFAALLYTVCVMGAFVLGRMLWKRRSTPRRKRR